MRKIKIYGKSPYSIALIHGGPGAPGSLTPLAEELSSFHGILELFQSEDSLEGQVHELKSLLEKHGDHPITLVGHSWGAWLSFIFASRYPQITKKIILVGSGPFKEEYAAKIAQIRLERLSDKEKKKVRFLEKELLDPNIYNKDRIFSGFGDLISRIDTYKPIPMKKKKLKCSYHVFKKVWKEAAQLRKSGELLKLGKKIQCPVLALHGDYDPHPAEGVKEPLSSVLKEFRFILLKNCGHEPWMEEEAREEFLRILKDELKISGEDHNA